jgi:hypothetical protein
MVAAVQERTDVRRLVTGGDPHKRYPIPGFTTDFIDAPDLKHIGDALIAECEEFSDLKRAIEEFNVEVRYVWRQKAAKSMNRVKAGTLQKAGGLIRHFGGAPYIVSIARDANLLATNLDIEWLVFHELYHILVEWVEVEIEGEVTELPALKVRSHDLETFHAEIERYGLHTPDQRAASPVFAQASLGMAKPNNLRLIGTNDE